MENESDFELEKTKANPIAWLKKKESRVGRDCAWDMVWFLC